MRLPLFTVLTTLILSLDLSLAAQPKAPAKARTNASAKPGETGQSAVVIDETLSVLRVKPSLFAQSLQRMRRGRKIQILATAEADGVRFYKVTAPPSSFGWVQADAVFSPSKPGDEERLARLVQAASGFNQIEVAIEFFQLYPRSKFRPSILLLFGDLLEEVAAKLSRDAGSRLNRKEMAAGGAPLHSYYLNFVSLDRYRKLDIVFLLNSSAREYHYDGAVWKEIVDKFPASSEAAEARKRLDALKIKMEKTVVE